MAFTHGKDAAFWLDNAAGTLTNYSAYIKSASIKRSADTAEVSTFGDGSKEFIAGMKDATISVEGPFDPTFHTALAAALGAEKSFEFGPEGGSTGDVKFSGECICTSIDPSASVDGAVMLSAEFQVTGAVTVGTFA